MALLVLPNQLQPVANRAISNAAAERIISVPNQHLADWIPLRVLELVALRELLPLLELELVLVLLLERVALRELLPLLSLILVALLEALPLPELELVLVRLRVALARRLPHCQQWPRRDYRA